MTTLLRNTLVIVSVLLLASCGKKDKPAAGSTGSGASASSSAPVAAAGGDGSSREAARSLTVGETVTGKLPCEAGKQSIWFRIMPGPIEGKAKLELRTPKQGDQSCVHLNAYDDAGKIVDTVVAPCSDTLPNFAVDEGPLGTRAVFLELRSTMGTCFTSDYKLTLSK